MNDNDRSILSITMLGHGMVHAYELAIPIFIIIWMDELQISAAVIGIVVAIGYALYGIGAVPSGVATDAYGSKRLLIVCLLGMGGSFLLLGLAGGLVGISVALLFWGAAASIYHPAGLRLISTGISRRGTGFAYHGIAGNLGIAVGPLIAVLLLIALEWRVVAIVMALPALAAAGYTAYVSVDETAEIPERDGGSIEDGSLRSVGELLRETRLLFVGGFILVFPIVILEGFFYRGVLTFLPNVLASYPSLEAVTVADREVDPARYVYVGLLFVGMGGQYVGGKLSDRMPPERAVIGAFAALAVLSALFVPAATVGLIPLLVVSALLGFVLFGEQPLLQAMVADYSSSDVRGLSYGYMFLGVFGVGALGAAFSGALLAYTTQQIMFLLLAVVPTIAAVLAATLTARDLRELRRS